MSISFGNAARLFGRGHLASRRVSSSLTPSVFSRSSGLTVCRGFASVRQQDLFGLSYNASRSRFQPGHVLPGLIFTRRYSKDTVTASEAAASTTPSGAVDATVSTPLLAEPVASATEDASTLAEAASSALDAIHTPLQYGDFTALGLAHWTPAGIVQWTMEIINTTMHLPWFWTIVAGSMIWRLVVFPTTVIGLRNSSRLQEYQPELLKAQQQMKEASKTNDIILKQKAALQMKGVYQKAGVSVWGGLLVPVVQIPVTLGVFFGVKNMCSLPVEQLKWSGLSFVPDLTIADPTWILPLIVTALVNVQIPLGASELDLKTRPGMGHLMNGLRVLSLFAVGITASFPAGVLVSLITTSVLTIIQSFLLQRASIRKYLGIRELPEKAKLPSMKQTLDYMIEGYKGRIKEAKDEHVRKIQRANASEQMKRFQEARKK